MEVTSKYIDSVLSNWKTTTNGILQFIKLTIEIAMEGERNLFKEETGDSSNGYRTRRVRVNGNKMQLRVPRTRQDRFIPLLPKILRTEEKDLGELAGYLFGNNKTKEDKNGIFNRLYAKEYEPNQLSRLPILTKEAANKWKHRALPNTLDALILFSTLLPIRNEDKTSKKYFFVVMSVDKNGKEDIVSVHQGGRKASGKWDLYFEDLKSRGLEEVGLIVSDGIDEISERAEQYFPKVVVRTCDVQSHKKEVSMLTQIVVKKNMA